MAQKVLVTGATGNYLAASLQRECLQVIGSGILNAP